MSERRRPSWWRRVAAEWKLAGELARLESMGRQRQRVSIRVRPVGCLLWTALVVLPWAVGVVTIVRRVS